jgi:hypothetical protein
MYIRGFRAGISCAWIESQGRELIFPQPKTQPASRLGVHADSHRPRIPSSFEFRHSSFVIHSDFGFRISDFGFRISDF